MLWSETNQHDLCEMFSVLCKDTIFVHKHGASSTETTRLIRDGEKGGKQGEGGEGDTEVGGEGDYIPVATLSPPE